VLEWRFPVLLQEFSIRRGSGGEGRHRGGAGAIRRILFREPMTAAILSSRRRLAPFGMAGGTPGQTGRNFVQRANGDIELLRGTDRVECIAPGDVFVIETPGGGGFGAKD
jgi:5-oxoprolinase (ATP-hydrolysing)